MQLFFKEEINIYHTFFLRESVKSKIGMTALDDFIRKIRDSAMNEQNIYEIQGAIRIMSAFCEILQNFNTNVETLISSVDEHTYNEVVDNSPDLQRMRFNDWFADLSTYQIDDTFTGVVTYILDDEKKLCFVKDLTKFGSIDFRDYLHSVLEGEPVYGKVFALKLNEKFLRAIRTDSLATNMSIRVRLIDIGETISVSPNAYKYNLIQDAKNLPPMAILCRVEKINGKLPKSLDLIHKKVLDVKLKDINVNMLEIDLSNEVEDENDSISNALTESMVEFIENERQQEEEHQEEHQEELHDVSYPKVARSAAATPNPFIDSPEKDNQSRGSAVATPNPFLDSPEKDNHNHVHSRGPTPLNFTTNGHNNIQTENQYEAKNTQLQNNGQEHNIQNNGQQQNQNNIKINENNIGFNISPVKRESPKESTMQPRPLPPVPPRQRPKAPEPIRIPLELVKKRPKADESDMNNIVAKNNAKNLEMGKSANYGMTAKNANGFPEKDEVKLNGNSCNNGIGQNGNDPCSCQSGAHPKLKKIQNENLILNAYPLRELLPTPAIGEELAVTPTHILTADQMYVQYNQWCKQFEDFQYNTLQKVQLRQLNYIPKMNDFVLARYSVDNMVYRARVEMIEQQIVTVFYVDYGNTERVDFDSLFEWDAICDTMPFQAVHCRIENIRYLPAASASAIFEFMQLNYLIKMCKAHILGYSNGTLMIKLTNVYGRDVVEEIKANLFTECIV